MWGEFNAKLCGYLLQGVMEAIRISCAGYPTRKNFDEFVQRFSILEPKVLKWYLHPLFVLSFLVIQMNVIVLNIINHLFELCSPPRLLSQNFN